MILPEVITAILIVLKLTDTITWPWRYVLLPEILAVCFYAALAIGVVMGAAKNDEMNRK